MSHLRYFSLLLFLYASLIFSTANAQDDLRSLDEEKCYELIVRADDGEELKGKELLQYRECRANRTAGLGVDSIGTVAEEMSSGGVLIAIILLILLL